MLGFPKTCPHGGTIPAKGELLVEVNNLPLSDIKEVGNYLLTRVHDSFEILQYLDKHAIILETNSRSKQFDGFSNTFLPCFTTMKNFKSASEIAKQLYVEKMN